MSSVEQLLLAVPSSFIEFERRCLLQIIYGLIEPVVERRHSWSAFADAAFSVRDGLGERLQLIYRQGNFSGHCGIVHQHAYRALDR